MYNTLNSKPFNSHNVSFKIRKTLKLTKKPKQPHNHQ